MLPVLRRHFLGLGRQVPKLQRSAVTKRHPRQHAVRLAVMNPFRPACRLTESFYILGSRS
jgi:hypothetical protein